MNSWININQQEPKYDERVLVYLFEEEPIIEMAQYKGYKTWHIANDDYINSVLRSKIKYWMPLPYAPKRSPAELKAIESLKSIAENPCLCDLGCPRCDAIEALVDMGITL